MTDWRALWRRTLRRFAESTALAALVVGGSLLTYIGIVWCVFGRWIGW